MRIVLPGATYQSVKPVRRPATLSGLGAAWGSATPTEFVSGLSLAIGGITQDVQDQFAATRPETAYFVDVMSTLIEAGSGAPIGSPMTPAIAGIVADMVQGVVQGDTLVSSIVGALGNAAGVALDAVVPVLGTLASMFAGGLADALNRPEITPQEQQALDSEYKAYCQDARAIATVSTGPGGVEPADMVVQGDCRMRLLECLAGGAARGTLFAAPPWGVTPERYNAWLAEAKDKYNIEGIPLHIQRQIILLLEGMYAARRDPDEVVLDIVGDNGRSLMPILLQLLLDQTTRSQRGLGKDAFSQDSLISLANRFIAPSQQFCVKGERGAYGGKAGATCKDYPACGESIGKATYNMVYRWNSFVNDKFGQAAEQVNSVPITSTLQLNNASTQLLMQKIAATQEGGKNFFRGEGFTVGKKILAGLGAIGFGYGIFTAVRAVGPRRG